LARRRSPARRSSSVTTILVAEKHSLGVVHIKPEAKTLGAALEIEDELWTVLGLVKARGRRGPAKQSSAS
jgi:hypothetical protein